MLSAMPPHTFAPQEMPTALLQAQQATPVLIALFDRDDMLQWANPAFRQAYGLSDGQHITWSDLMLQSKRLGVGALIHTDDMDQWLASVRSRRGKQAFRAFEADLCDGRWIWMTETLTPDGSMLCVACDITHLRHDERLLRQELSVAQRAAMTDVLTGISNRTHILAQLEEHLERARCQRISCGLVLLDLDHFKRINDNYGHAAGDTVLRHFAQLLSHTLRREDSFGRVGGEEFLLLLPNTCAESLPTFMERLLGMLPLQRPLDEHPDFFYTCSAGITLIHPEDTATTALQRADEALYAAKARGRNCFTWGSPAKPR